MLQAACDCTARPGGVSFSSVTTDVLRWHNCWRSCYSELSVPVQVSVQTGVLVLSAPFMRLMWIVFCAWRVSCQRLNNAEGELCFKLRKVWHLQLSRACSRGGLCKASPSQQAMWGTSPILCPQLKKKVESFIWWRDTFAFLENKTTFY